LYLSLNIIWVFISRKTKLVGRVTRMPEKRMHTVFGGKIGRKEKKWNT